MTSRRISSRGSGDVPIGLSFSCEWNANDIGVRLVGDTIEEIGNAYVALDPGAGQ